MFKLAIDTSGKQIILSIAVMGKEGVNVTTSLGNEPEKLSVLIDEHLSGLDLPIEDLEQILIGIGPGHFTGIRTGVAYGKALAYGRKTEIKTFSLLDVIRYSFIKENKITEETSVYIFMDAKNQSVFVSTDSVNKENLSLIDLKNWSKESMKKKPAVVILYGDWGSESVEKVRIFFNESIHQVICQEEVQSLSPVFEEDFWKKKRKVKYSRKEIFKINPNYLRRAV